MKSADIAAILAQLNDECGRLHDLQPYDDKAARIVLIAYDAIGDIRAHDVPLDRMDRFNGSGGALSWSGRSFALHPDRCQCQKNDSIPHRHYSAAPYGCARCGCTAYHPHDEGAGE